MVQLQVSRVILLSLLLMAESISVILRGSASTSPTMPNIEYLLRGYDYMYGNPHAAGSLPSIPASVNPSLPQIMMEEQLHQVMYKFLLS